MRVKCNKYKHGCWSNLSLHSSIFHSTVMLGCKRTQ